MITIGTYTLDLEEQTLSRISIITTTSMISTSFSQVPTVCSFLYVLPTVVETYKKTNDTIRKNIQKTNKISLQKYYVVK